MTLFLLCISISCNQATKQKQESRDITDPAIHEITGEGKSLSPLPPSESNATFKVYRNDDGNLNGFGYDIYINGSDKPYVHQPNIPAVSGNKGFSTEDDARHTAELMVYKIKHNIMPPSVSVAELDSLGIK